MARTEKGNGNGVIDSKF